MRLRLLEKKLYINRMKNKIVLVNARGGFIGLNLCKTFLELANEIIYLDDFLPVKLKYIELISKK